MRHRDRRKWQLSHSRVAILLVIEMDSDQQEQNKSEILSLTSHGQVSPLISEEVMTYFNILVGVVVHGTVAFIGVLSNLVNISVFAKLGLEDSMSVGLFSLSVTDGLVCVFQLAMCASNLAHVLCPHAAVDVLAVQYVTLGWMRHIFYLISAWITALISLERCFCVAFPFQVRQVFTRCRCVLVIAIICVSHLAMHVPIYLTQDLQWVNMTFQGTEGARHRVVKTVVFSENRAEVEVIVDTLGAITLSALAQLLVLAGSLWMIHALSVTSKVRSTSHNGRPAQVLSTDHSGRPTQVRGAKSMRQTSHAQMDKARRTKLTSRERKLVQVVLFLSVMLTVCNIPRYSATAAYHIVPTLHNWTYPNLVRLCMRVSQFFNTLCSAINFIVYYKLNSSYASLILSRIAPSSQRKRNPGSERFPSQDKGGRCSRAPI